MDYSFDNGIVLAPVCFWLVVIGLIQGEDLKLNQEAINDGSDQAK
jgi:hypothetical protein